MVAVAAAAAAVLESAIAKGWNRTKRRVGWKKQSRRSALARREKQQQEERATEQEARAAAQDKREEPETGRMPRPSLLCWGYDLFPYLAQHNRADWRLINSLLRQSLSDTSETTSACVILERQATHIEIRGIRATIQS